MNETLEESSVSSLTPSWKIAYEQAIVSGISIEELLDNLEEELRMAEYSTVWSHKELEDLRSVEMLSKSAIHYNERLTYLQNKIELKYRK